MNALTSATPPRTRAVGPVLQPQSFQELVRFAEMAAGSDLMPRDYKGKPANIMLAVQMGSELGLSPMQAVQNIAVVNGRPSVWGDALLGLVVNSPKCQDVNETIAGEGDARTATCTVKRIGASDTVRTFSVGDAKKAGLWGKQGPWQQYPDRMLQMRARGFALRDSFPDVLRGLITAEEAQDIPADTFQGTTVAATAEPTPPPATRPAGDPVEAVRARLADCTDADCVAKVADGWVKTVAARSARGQPVPAIIDEQVKELLADAFGRFQHTHDNDYGDAGEPGGDDGEMPE